MKKLMIFSAAALAGINFALAGIQLSGSAYVGYTPVAVSAGNTILSVPFCAFATGDSIELDKLVSTSGLTGSEDPAEADQLIVFIQSTSTYQYYYLNSDKNWTPLNTVVAGVENTDTPPSIDEVKLSNGYGVWLKTVSSKTAYLQGQVKDPTGMTIVKGLNLVGSGYPTDLDLNNSTQEWPADVTKDQILITGDNDSLITLRYANGKWMKSIMTESSTSILGIPVTQETLEDAPIIKAGTSFWYRRNGASSFTLNPAPKTKE